VLSQPRSFGWPLRSSLYLVREQERETVTLEAAAGSVGLRTDRWELTLEERFRPRRNLELALSYDVQWLELSIETRPGPPLSLRPARLIPTVLLDGRNSVLDPGRGYFSSLSYNYGAEFLGSQFDLRRLFAQQFVYLPAPRGIVSASGLRYERSSGDGQAFLTTGRLGFGGATTVRGYDQDERDVLNLLSAFGASTRVLVLNQELRFPLLGDLRGVAFLDYGRALAVLDGESASETRLGTGLGLRYSTPVGVLRFDVGYALKDGDQKPRYYFGLGQAF
jgi:outer membrane translocation and assembly module TamA